MAFALLGVGLGQHDTELESVLVSNRYENGPETTSVHGRYEEKGPEKDSSTQVKTHKVREQIDAHIQLLFMHTQTIIRTIITPHYIRLMKKWNSAALFLNKNAYRRLKRSVLRSKSPFCFNHVWVLLLLNTDIHTYQGNEDAKTPRTPTTSGIALDVANHSPVRVSVCIWTWRSPCACVRE